MTFLPRATCSCRVLAGVAGLVLLSLGSEGLEAQQRGARRRPPAAEKGEKETVSYEQALKRLADRDRELAKLEQPGQPAPKPVASDTLRWMTEIAHLGVYYGPDGPARYLALELRVVNPTQKTISLKKADLSLTVDAQPLSWQKLPREIQHHGFQVGARHVSLNDCPPWETVEIAPLSTQTLWVIWPHVSHTTEVPQLTVQVRTGDKSQPLDINRQEYAALQLQEERIGPRGCLALLTINGSLNSINVGDLVRRLESLAGAGSPRVVLNWGSTAVVPDGQILSWLQNSARQPGFGRAVSESLPTLPATLEELHLVRFSNGQFPSNNPDQSDGKVHKTLAEATSAALRTAFLVLPERDLLAEIQDGHPLSRSAALRYGASRLNQSRLPYLLSLTKDPDANLQRAALEALAEFPDETALAHLQAQVQSPDPATQRTAIRSLASSRYASHQASLKTILRTANEPLRQVIYTVLSEQPRSDWSDALFAAAHDAQDRWNLNALKAVVSLGHPNVVDLLEDGLASSEGTVRQFSFQILSQRSDQRSEALAVNELLKRLETRAPDQEMQQLIRRTRDPRTLPLLLKLLETSKERGSLINALAMVGDQSTGDHLQKLYPKLQSHEKASAMNALRILKHPASLSLAGEAVASKEPSLISAGSQVLTQDGSEEACTQLLAALEKHAAVETKSLNTYAISVLCNALSTFSDPRIRLALAKLQASENESLRLHARTALQQIRTRSPGYQYIYQAMSYSQREQWEEAEAFYTLALQLDPLLPEAWSGRGNVRLRLDRIADSGTDFSEAMKLDPENAMGITGLALVHVMSGRDQEAFALIDQHRPRFKEDGLFLYNTACVYGRALEKVLKQPKSDEQAALAQKFREQSLKDLSDSIDQGFDDFEWMQKDPDLKPLHDDPAFKKLADRPIIPRG